MKTMMENELMYRGVLALLTVVVLSALMIRFRGKKAAFAGHGRGGMIAENAIPNQHFSDVAAQDEAVAALREMADMLRFPEKYTCYGARLPRGVLLYGPPGTGKTLLARALAGEAGVPFFSVCGSDFVQMYVGVGAGRVRDLFKKARKAGKAVIFIDEIDALGSRREGGNDEREQTLNALLTEMSGFRDESGVMVLAATNRPERLDAALLRPGRFDRQLEIGMPDRAGRLQILLTQTRNKPLGADVDLERLAADTVSFSGAKLESMLNEAALCAARRGTGWISREDVEEAFQTVVAGAEKQERPGAQERRITAYHEAGHALATLLCEPESRLSRVSIIPSTKGAAGYSMAIPPDRQFLTMKQAKAQLHIALGGRAAEEIVFGPSGVTCGAANDLRRATELAAKMCLEWGMDEQSGLAVEEALARWGAHSRENGVERLLQEALKEVRKQLESVRTALDAAASALLEKEKLEGEEILRILEENSRTIDRKSA